MMDIMFEDCFVIKWYQYSYFKHMQISTLNWETARLLQNQYILGCFFSFTEISC